jgi:5-methyltetrahydrofolate--homocysteine methyltransferase
MGEELTKAVANLEEDDAVRITLEKLDQGQDPLSILEESRKGMEIVGEGFSKGKYFLPELIYSGQILKEIARIIKPKIVKDVQTKRIGKFILGTVAGDIHDIGKNIVSFLLDVNGFEVFDIGIDAPPQRFVEKIKETNAPMVGLSGLLTLAFDAMKKTIEAIKEAGLRDNVKIIIGGSQVDETVQKYTGADAYAKDAMEGVSLAKTWLGGY